jgi:hypothetical protein
MNNESVPAEQTPDGKMMFYKQPELLNHQVHGALGLVKPERPFEFARKTRAVPVTVPEFQVAQKSFPIIFSELDNPMPLAVVGRADDINLFVDADGNWAPGVYIPAYVRRYPFALATRSEDQFVVVVDRAADSVSETPEQPFFDGEKLTPQTQSLIDFCGQYDAEIRATAHFGVRLRELGLLTGQQVSRKNPDGEDEVIANYVAVDVDKLNKLEGDVLQELFKNGYLSAIFAHLFSLENWQRVLDRHVRQGDDESAEPA